MKYNYTSQLIDYFQKIKRFYPLVSAHYTLSGAFIVNEPNLTSLLAEFTAYSVKAIAEIKEIAASNALSEAQEERAILLKTYSQNTNSLDINLLKQSATAVYKALEIALQAQEIAENTLSILIKNFESALKRLSDAIAKYKIDIPSSLFSLGGYLENLETNYEDEYDKKYWMTASLRRLLFRKVDRLQDIHFIMMVNAHADADDKLRYALIYVVISKMSQEKRHSKNTSILKKMLDTGVECVAVKPTPNSLRAIGLFCAARKSIVVPENLSAYINQNRLSPRTY